MLKAASIPSVISNMITNSGLLLFFKRCCSKFVFSNGNESALALPLLIDAVLHGYLSSPDSWDGNVKRIVWVQEFSHLVSMLIQIIPSLHNSNATWSCTFIYRVLKLSHSLVSASNRFKSTSVISMAHLLILQSSISYFYPKESVYPIANFWNLDALFSVDVNSVNFNAGAMLFEILVATDPILSSKSGPLFSWLLASSSSMESSAKLLKWLLKLQLDSSILAPLQDSFLKFIASCLCNQMADDRFLQLARANLGLFLRDSKPSLKRSHQEIDRGTAKKAHVTEKLQTTDLTGLIEKWIQSTPTPRYLLSIEYNQTVDSFTAVALGHLMQATLISSSKDVLLLWDKVANVIEV